MEFLAMDDALDIHAGILMVEEGEPGILHPGALASALDRCRWGPFPATDDLFSRATMLLRGIAQDHPFVDGNKRTAFQATHAFLRGNGKTLVASGHATDRFMVEVAKGEHAWDSIRAWLVRHAKDNTEVD